MCTGGMMCMLCRHVHAHRNRNAYTQIKAVMKIRWWMFMHMKDCLDVEKIYRAGKIYNLNVYVYNRRKVYTLGRVCVSQWVNNVNKKSLQNNH